MREWYVKWGAIIIAAYIILFGFPRLVKCDVVDDLNYKYGYDLNLLISKLNSSIEMNNNNCMSITDVMYDILNSRQYSGVRKIGIYFLHRTKGHSAVLYRNNWGSECMILMYPKEGVLELVNVKFDTKTLDTLYPKWSYLKEYTNKDRDDFVLTKRDR